MPSERDIKNFVGKLGKQMEQYAKHVGTDVSEYQRLKILSDFAGLTLSKKGNYEIPSAGKESVKKLTEMTDTKFDELRQMLESSQTWGNKKEYYEKRVNQQNRTFSSRAEKEKAISDEIKKDDFINMELNSFIHEIYQFIQKNTDSGIYLDTLGTKPYQHYSEAEIDLLFRGQTDDLEIEYDKLMKYVEEIQEEMNRGGTQAEIDDEISSELWHIQPEEA